MVSLFQQLMHDCDVHSSPAPAHGLVPRPSARLFMGGKLMGSWGHRGEATLITASEAQICRSRNCFIGLRTHRGNRY